MDREELIRQRTYSPIVKKIDKNINELEKLQQIIQKEEYEQKMEELQKQLFFVEQYGIITIIESWNYHERIKKIQRQYQNWKRKKMLRMMDDLEILREQELRYDLMEKWSIDLRRKEKKIELKRKGDIERGI